MKNLVLLLLAGITTSMQVVAQETLTPAQAVFERLKALTGEYKVQGLVDTTVTYRLTAKDSVLLETWQMPNNREEMTAFHMDGEHLVATHYCASNHQPTMQWISTQSPVPIEFRMISVRNLASLDMPHNSGFSYQLAEDKRVIRNEIWKKEGNEDVSTLILLPTPPSSAASASYNE
ncbi:hypothetical protein P2G88_04110 [Aliiglaciecola sp. CAU 1673]|uniref:hypothetical protein n=1 Tax=Aliiglaciecola sp. CAU 1673 TaxID=3032595 RepID=UPI0023DBC37E|nr:hypothetical protein [Aliiglaciecola sp. CAU 1673]MDF2177429.1 hypothetical protein [Aliiglaciecola sp. CAU 1673]